VPRNEKARRDAGASSMGPRHPHRKPFHRACARAVMKKDDPRNWSQLRQRLEAWKKNKELRSVPRQEVPEALVRSVLAEQYGIMPEEVTPEQIRLAVADLLRHYPSISLVSLVTIPSLSEPDTEKKASRKSFVTPLLKAKGWSILDWANKANVSHATAMDYLQDKTAPYRSTRLKLATALGIPVEELPK